MHVDKSIENLRECLCLECPSYTKFCKKKNVYKDIDDKIDMNKLGHLEMMFCAFEKSDCIHENLGCLCMKCPVHKKYALNSEDYCLATGGVL